MCIRDRPYREYAVRVEPADDAAHPAHQLLQVVHPFRKQGGVRALADVIVTVGLVHDIPHAVSYTHLISPGLSIDRRENNP